jgi:hypothetical protein
VGEANSESGPIPAIPNLPPPLTPVVVREQLSRLLRNPSFADSARASQLIEYLVERVLHGEAGDLKEFTLAADVFGRGSDFDPKLDSIVRAQVSRLRAKLLEYYEGDGRRDPVRFDLPRRGYALRLSANSQAPVSSHAGSQRKQRYWKTAALLAAVAAIAILSGDLRHQPRAVPTLSLTRLTPEVPPVMHPSISRDGKLLSYSQVRQDGSIDIYVQQMAGGPPLKIVGPRFNSQQSLSPDGSRVVFASYENGGGIYVVPALGGSPKRVAPLGQLPSFSADGKWVIYGRYFPVRREVYVVPASGGEPRRMHPEFDQAYWAMWAPDGETYFFNGRSKPREETDYWIASLDGSRLVATGLRRKFSSLGLANSDIWLAVMQWVKDWLYVETNDGDVQKLWRIRIDPQTWGLGETPELLGSFLARQPQPSIAENGQFVVANLFNRYSDWIAPLDPHNGRLRGAMRPVTDDIDQTQPELLSGDGRHIVYATRGRGVVAYWRKDLTSGVASIIQVTPAPSKIGAISYDATRLYYEAGAGAGSAVYRAGITEGAGQKLCQRCCLLAVSADEKMLLSCPPEPAGGIALRRLGAGGVTELLPPGVSTRGLFQFSPDGQWLAFSQTSDWVQGRIFIVPVRNQSVAPGDWIVVADEPGLNVGPAWSLDAQILYFRSNRDGRSRVWAQRLDPRTKHPLGQPIDIYEDESVPWELYQPTVAANMMLLRRSKLTSGLWSGKLP